MSEAKIAGHLAGIDFTKPVEVVNVEEGVLLSQYQVPGRPRGSYYSPAGDKSSPSSLGIHDKATDRDGHVIDKVAATYTVNKSTRMLKSTAKPIKDTWSIPKEEHMTAGGATQLYSSDLDVVLLAKSDK
jgi:hypothetical protein